MLIREYTEDDLDSLRRMHALQGFDYAFPDLADPIFVSKLVLEDDSGRAVMASLARLTCEMYLLADPAEGTPRERYARLLALHRAGERDMYARGLDDAHAWLPPRIAAVFNGNTYCYQVTAALSGSESSASNQATAVILAPPASSAAAAQAAPAASPKNACTRHGTLVSWLRCVAALPRAEQKK